MWLLASAALAAAALAGCNGSSVTSAGIARTTPPTYSNVANIAIPGVPPATGAPFSFDISFVDPTARRYYLADRTTGGVDVYNVDTNMLLGTAGGFTGAVQSGGVVNNNLAGPNGVVAIGNGLVAAGDGNSTLKIVNVASLAVVATQLSAANPFTGTLLPQVAAGCVNPAGGVTSHAFRLDEIAYDPTDQVILAINDTDCPPYGTFFNANAPYNVLGAIAFGTSYNGVEQPVWDPGQKQFLVNNPQTVANPNGEIDAVDPNAHTITRVMPMPASCIPHGLAVGPNEQIVVGCNVPDSQIYVLSATSGSVVSSVPGYGGSDECWYDSGANRYYCALSGQTPAPLTVVVDAGSGGLVTTIPTSTQAHSVAADAQTKHVFIPQRAAGISVFSVY
jgi:hypothetical protein